MGEFFANNFEEIYPTVPHSVKFCNKKGFGSFHLSTKIFTFKCTSQLKRKLQLCGPLVDEWFYRDFYIQVHFMAEKENYSSVYP